METKKQTAVEWLVKEIKSKYSDIDFYHIKKEIDQAKAMEKKQIMDAIYDNMGTNFDPNMGRAEQYYNETYGQ
jgi:disulfide oxidoreductase YuzD